MDNTERTSKRRMTPLTIKVLDTIPDEWVSAEEIITSTMDLVPPGVALRFAASKRKDPQGTPDHELIRSGKRGKILATFHTLTLFGYIEKRMDGPGVRGPFSLRKAPPMGSQTEKGEGTTSGSKIISVSKENISNVNVRHSHEDGEVYLYISIPGLDTLKIEAAAAARLALRVDAQSIVARRSVPAQYVAN